MWGLEDVRVTFGGRVALDLMSVDVLPGAITTLVGGDGAGKSTALRCLVGALRPNAGKVRRPPPERIGYLSAGPSGPGVYPDLTVDENIAFAAQAYGVAPAAAAPRAIELTARAGLAEARDRLASALSGGMRQKLALVCALIHEPDLLVLDEPTTGVDPVSRSELWRLLSQGAAGGMAVVLATTYLDEAERAALVVVLHDGRVLLTGSPEDVTAAVPGTVVEADHPDPDRSRSWRHGRRFRTWRPAGGTSAGESSVGERVVRPSLEDAVIVAALAEAGGFHG